MTALLENLTVDRFVFPHQLNLLSDSVLLVRLSEADLRDHSFLDERILRQGMNYEWLDWSKFAAAAEALPEKVPAYVFHVGHCGSTLLSRLICAATGTQALREPLPMRTIAFDQADGRAALLADDVQRARLRVFERVWTRGASKTVVKASSMCSNLMERVDSAASIAFIYQQAETHLAVTLAGENTLQDLRGFAQNRYRRLQESDIDMQPLAEFTVGELAALAWLTEVVSASRVLTRRTVATLDFDRFLEQPGDSLADVCRRLDLETGPERCRIALSGPIMRTYSKAPEHAYGPELRKDIIEDSRVRNGNEIARGMQWINVLAARNAEVTAAVNALSSAP